MNAKNVKQKQVTCIKCGHIIMLNTWGISKTSQYEGAIERAHKKLRKEMKFGIKEKYENN